MAEIERFNNVQTQTRDGEWVRYSDHAQVVAEKDARIAELGKLSRAFRNRLVSELTSTNQARGLGYEMARVTAEHSVNEFEDAFLATISHSGRAQR